VERQRCYAPSMIDRRSALQGFGALAAAMALPAEAAAPGGSRKPPRLKAGDTVALIAPASFSDHQEELDGIKATIAAMGLVPKSATNVLTRYGYLAGTDAQRAASINAMYADRDVRALFSVHGGWGSARILPYLDWKTIRANPKLLVGFSDVTALHIAFAAMAGFPTIHAPNAANNWRERSWTSFWELAFSGGTPTFAPPPAPLPPVLSPAAAMSDSSAAASTSPPPPAAPVLPPMPNPFAIQTIRPGKASGRLIGGNLSVLVGLVGTPYFPDTTGAILFLEDAGEAEYRIDRMLTHLALAGVLKKAAGIVFGQCRGCHIDVPDYKGFTLDQLLFQHFGRLGVPSFSGAQIGHIANQYCIPVGVRAEIDAAAGTIRMLESAVS
jgi:muramoyltetrapeptide carboxypeptidase